MGILKIKLTSKYKPTACALKNYYLNLREIIWSDGEPNIISQSSNNNYISMAFYKVLCVTLIQELDTSHACISYVIGKRKVTSRLQTKTKVMNHNRLVSHIEIYKLPFYMVVSCDYKGYVINKLDYNSCNFQTYRKFQLSCRIYKTYKLAS